MMQHPDWKCRHAALMAISAAGEGCHKQMESYLPQIMEAVMNFVTDSVSYNTSLVDTDHFGHNYIPTPPKQTPCPIGIW